MEDADSSGDSNMEFDQQEMEVALYSQIHFGSATDSEAWFDSSVSQYRKDSLPLRIGVKELPARSTLNLKKPIFDGEFIAFSNSDSFSDGEGGGSEEGRHPGPRAVSPQTEKDGVLMKPVVADSEKNKPSRENLSEVEAVASQNGGEVSSAVSLGNETTDSAYRTSLKQDAENIEKFVVKTALSDSKKAVQENKSAHDGFANVKKVSGDDVKNKIVAVEGSKTSVPTEVNEVKCDRKKTKQKEAQLSFCVTKATSKSKSVTENVSQDKKTGRANSEYLEKRKFSQPAKNNLKKLESFLELSESKRDCSVVRLQRKVPLSKADAAVKAIKPTVCLRKKPSVLVRYHLDSDTNTEYSDSEASISASPVKVGQITQKDNSQNSVLSSYTDLPCKDIEAGDESAADKINEEVINESENNEENVNKEGSNSQAVADEPQKMPDDKSVSGGEEEDVSSCSDDVAEHIGSEDCETSCVNEEGNTAEEEVHSDSEDSDSSDPVDFSKEVGSDLEFNLDREVAESLFSKSGADIWKINDKDRLNVTSTISRYFFPRAIECRNCKMEGHLSRDCPQPLKRRCIFCAVVGHTYQVCPQAICFKCGVPGHKFSDCRDQKRNLNTMCDRCWMPGHHEERCPDRWRQYHKTTNPRGNKLVTDKKNVRQPLVFCYNCGRKGHLGFECKLPRMSKFTVATYPLIARYDTKNKRKEMMQGSGDFTKGSEKSKPEKKSKKQRCLSESKDRYGHHNQSKGHKSEASKTKRKHKLDDERMRGQNSSPQKRHHRHDDVEEEYGQEGRERKRKRREKKKKEYKTDLRSDDGRLYGSLPGVQGGKGAMFVYMGHKQNLGGEVSSDGELLSDLETHQVNDNEWWNNRYQPARKRRKRNKEMISTSFTGNEHRKDRLNQRDLDSVAYHESPAARSEDRSQSHRSREEWGYSQQQQRGQKKQGQRPFLPEFGRKQKTETHYRSGGNKFSAGRLDRDQSNYTQNRRQKSPPASNNFRTGGHLHHAASWPLLSKPVTKSALNKGGFHARNDRFVAMKKNFDITVNLRR